MIVSLPPTSTTPSFLQCPCSEMELNSRCLRNVQGSTDQMRTPIEVVRAVLFHGTAEGESTQCGAHTVSARDREHAVANHAPFPRIDPPTPHSRLGGVHLSSAVTADQRERNSDHNPTSFDLTRGAAPRYDYNHILASFFYPPSALKKADNEWQ